MKEINIQLTRDDIWPPWYKRLWLTITFRRHKYVRKLKAVWFEERIK